MGRFLRQYDKEYMKMAMLKQEQTFREQVNELHRLYRIQKLLMRDVTRAAADLHARRPTARGRRRRAAAAMLDLEIPAADGAEEEDEDDDDEGAADVELTLATGASAWRGRRGRKKADSSDSGSGAAASFSSSASTESGSGASGCGSGGESLDVRDWGLWYRGPVGDGPGPVAVAVRQGGRAADQRPAWQLQYLSLNMT